MTGHWGILVIVGLVALVVGAVLGHSLGHRRAGRADPGPGPSTSRPERGDVVAQRDALARACIEVGDLVTSVTLQRLLAEALVAGGISAIDPIGEAFDPRLHRAVGICATGDADRSSTVARTERVGYTDGRTTVRPPEVIVYRYEVTA